MTGLARADRLRPVGTQLAVLLVISALWATAVFVSLPWWLTLVLTLVVGWLVASYIYVHASILTGRTIATCVVAGTLVLAWCPGWWKAGALLPALGIVVFTGFRLHGSRQPDACSPDRTSVPEFSDHGNRLVDAIDTIWGSTRPGGPRHGLRAAHSHGSMAVGTWRSSPSPTLNGFAVTLFGPDGGGPVVARFSNFESGVVRDDWQRSPRGFAVRLDGGDSGSLDLVLVDIRRFPTATREDFVGLTRAFAARGVVRGWQVGRMIFGGRSSLLAVGQLLFGARPTSYVTRTYHSLNSFSWTRITGHHSEQVPVRYVATPVNAERGRRSDSGPRRTSLDDDLRSRLANGQVEFDVWLVLGTSRHGRPLPPHRVDNPLRKWPHRNRHRLCRITLHRYYSEPEPPHRFDPLDLPDGIRPSDDEILLARRAAYPASYLRRALAPSRAP